ncbi:uncharacterized protein LOC110982437 isoform X2 [Acanthaster planci]|nr:uncharacterized protein LOC110982437 isoform X2 [Acanthaster planci]
MLAELLLILCLTSANLGHIIRRDADQTTSVTMATVPSEFTTSRTSIPASSSANDAPNQLPISDESDEPSEVNNILGAIMTEYEDVDGGAGFGYDPQIQDIQSQLVEVHATTTITVDPATPSTNVPTTSSTPVDTSTSTMRDGAVTTEENGSGSQDSDSASTSEPQGEAEMTRCQEPPENQLRLDFKRNNQHVKFPALAILPQEVAARDEAESLVTPPLREEYVNLTCPVELLRVSGIVEVNRRSLCPWTYVADVDPDRYPSTIQIAKCRCPRCIDTSLAQEGAFSNENDCHQVLFRMKVLRRGPCVNGMFMYHNVYEDIPVACACLRPKTL